MSKKKSNNKAKVTKFTTDIGIDLLRPLFEEAVLDHSNHMLGEEQLIGQLAASAMNAALGLSKLIIDNRILNSQKMDDDNIYNIYSKSFKSIVKIATEDPLS